jgi:hypothetical protein
MNKPIGVTLLITTNPPDGGIPIPIFLRIMDAAGDLVKDLESRVPDAHRPGNYVAMKELRMDKDSGTLVLEAWMNDTDHKPVECEVPK